MRWIICPVCLLIALSAARADDLTDNPAFCFGVVSAQSQDAARVLTARRAGIEAVFAKSGPKDSTDGRGFDDWAHIGRDMVAESNDAQRAAYVTSCRGLLGMAMN